MNLHRTILLSFLVLCSSFSSCDETDDVFTYKLGDSNIQLERFSYKGASALSIVHLHDNEATAKLAAQETLQAFGGTLLTLNNKRNRLVKFNYAGQNFLFDPNRMFTQTGRKASLTKLSRYDEKADSFLSGFAHFFLEKIPESETLVSVHNNTNGAYSILSYEKGGSLQKDAEMLHQNKEQDRDDFFITTDTAIFNYLKEANYNVVLQQNTHATDDGSLSIFYGRKNKSYVNVEAEHGHLAEQKKMVSVLVKMMEGHL